jgi:hypothetical protein
MEKGISTRGKMNGKDKKNGWMERAVKLMEKTRDGAGLVRPRMVDGSSRSLHCAAANFAAAPVGMTEL